MTYLKFINQDFSLNLLYPLSTLPPTKCKLSKHVACILKPLTGNTHYTVKNSMEFCNYISTVNFHDDEELVSFDVVSLFTSTPVEHAVEVAHHRLSQDATLSQRTDIRIPDLTNLLKFCLSSTYFQYSMKLITNRFWHSYGISSVGNHAKYGQGILEQQALATTIISLRFWKRYVDDVCSAIKPSQIDSLQSPLNSCQPSIQFTTETETNGSIAFLDMQVIRGAHCQSVHNCIP